MAGTGKSTIARTVARQLLQRNLLGASFFFSRGRGLRTETTGFFTTIALELAKTIPSLTPYICKVIEENENIAEKSPTHRWDHLIIRHLTELSRSILTPLSLAIVIDALDECTGVQYVPGLIQLFSRARNLHMVQLRIFLTSRRESYIQEMFNKVPHVVYHDLMLDSANDTDQTKQDISVFIADELAKVAEA
jgi:hypothetical protein